MGGWIDLDKEFDMRKTLLFVLLLIVGCSQKSVDKTTLFEKDEPVYGGQKILPGKTVKASLDAPTDLSLIHI